MELLQGFLVFLAPLLCTVTGGNVGLGVTDQLGRPPSSYTAHDDASWAIMSRNVSHVLGDKQKLYDTFIGECVGGDKSCQDDDDNRMEMNRWQTISVHNYTSTGFKKIRAPDTLFKLLKEFWDANKDHANTEYDDETAYHNTWQVPTKILMTEDESFVGGGWNLSAAVWNAARDILEEWTGQKLAGSSVYGIRVYHNQSILTPHVDRMPLISSAIINVAQDVEEDWLLEVYGHDGKATNVSMAPGDMVLYESHSVIHGRPFPLNGKFYANIFVHFEPMGDPDSTEPLPKDGSRPPYLIPGSPWEEEYFANFPYGWDLLTDLESIAQRGDLYTLQYVAQRDPKSITDDEDTRCSIMVFAIFGHHSDMIAFLIDDMGYDVNMVCTSETPLDCARAAKDEGVTSFLKEKGALPYKKLIQKHPELTSTRDSRCVLVKKAIQTAYNEHAVEFLFDEIGLDVNMVCNGRRTPVDFLFDTYNGEDDGDPSEEDDPIYAFLLTLGGERKLSLKNFTNAHPGHEDRCHVLSNAIPWNSLDLVDFLLHEMKFDVNMVCDDSTALDMVYEHFDVEHDMVEYLVERGGKTFDKLEDGKAQERCRHMVAVTTDGDLEMLQSLLHHKGYSINMVCSTFTPLDVARLKFQDESHPIISFLLANGGIANNVEADEEQRAWGDEL